MTNEQWFGTTVETDGVPMFDPGIGRPLILRTFEFAVKPSQVGQKRPTNAELFNFHWPQIRDMIRFDGLIENRDIAPRVVIGKKRYRIFVLCEPKFRTMINETPQTLQQIIKPKSSVASKT